MLLRYHLISLHFLTIYRDKVGLRVSFLQLLLLAFGHGGHISLLFGIFSLVVHNNHFLVQLFSFNLFFLLLGFQIHGYFLSFFLLFVRLVFV